MKEQKNTRPLNVIEKAMKELCEAQSERGVFALSTEEMKSLPENWEDTDVRTKLFESDCFYIVRRGEEIFLSLTIGGAVLASHHPRIAGEMEEKSETEKQAKGFRCREEAVDYVEGIVAVANIKEEFKCVAYEDGLPGIYIDKETSALFLEEEAKSMTPEEIDKKLKNCIDISEVVSGEDALIFEAYIQLLDLVLKDEKLAEKLRYEEETEEELLQEDLQLTPKEIKEFLDRHVYRQDTAKIAAATMLYCHTKGMRRTGLFIGPSGCGKTEIFRTLKKLYPFIYIYDASSITNDGWSGGKKTYSVFQEMLASGMTKEEIEHSVIVFDEFDKLCVPKISKGGENVAASVQGEFLSMIEGSNVSFKGLAPDVINTENITFVFLGAFEDLYKEREHKRTQNAIGFATAKEEGEVDGKLFTAEDLIRFGIRTEIMGRIGKIVQLNNLEEEDFYNILKDDNISPVKKLMKNISSSVVFSDEHLREIAKAAAKTGLGVRYLKTQIENEFDAYIFENGL